MNFEYHYIYLLFTFFLGIYFLAILLNKDWVLFPGDGKYNFDYFIKIFGRTIVRCFIGLLTLIGILISFSAFYYQQNKNNLTINTMEDKLTNYYEQFTNFLALNPSYIYLIFASIGFIISFGFFKDWDWLMETSSGSRNDRGLRFWLELVGRNVVRKYLGYTFLLAAIVSLLIFFFDDSKPKQENTKDNTKIEIPK